MKLLAVIVMLIDHTAAFVLYLYKPAMQPILFIGSYELSLYKIMRYIGRTAFPIFVFLLVEGFCHTHNKKKYGINLLIFAVLSELPWNLLHSGTCFYDKQNVFFTLLLGYIGMVVIERYKDTKIVLSKIKQATILFVLLLLSMLLKVDYGVVGFGYIVLIYILKDNRIFQVLLGIAK